MSVFQNFKNADHTFEKNFFKAIFGIALCIALFFFIDKTFDKVPDVKKLFVDNGRFFRWFLFSSIGVFIFSYTTYVGTLDLWEAETKASITASIISVVLWTMIWISWSIFCGWLTLSFYPKTQLVKFTIIGLVIIPGLTGFLFSRNIRRQQLRQEEEDKKFIGADYFNSELYTICRDKKYYSGYYGLLCLPVYSVTLLVGQFL